MEQHHLPRRSASHGMLRSTYSSHGGGAMASPIRPLHKPLRSVNENSVLLHSPGALESMLKTTTETGDIGIFTIRAVPPSPLRSRVILSEVGHPYPKPSRSIDDMHRQNPSRRPPSLRDVTPEAFSVYGSDSLKSATSTLSPISTEDPGQRSYSMTTCGSRNLSHYKSTNTLQSQASGSSHLQRPRSPFPYPTRLKRPGVRPISPAVTENGKIDYSRMVEINRVSYRTGHSHFKYAYSPTSRRPLPLGLRVDINRSTPSLAPPGPPPGPPPNFRGPPRPPSARNHSPASMPSWNSHFQERLDSISTRASSFTSVTNTHRRMPPLIREDKNCIVETPPRYYDYTEEFEDKASRLVPLNQEFASLPPRMVRYPRSMLFRGDDNYLSTGHLATVFGEGDSAFFERESQIVEGRDGLSALTTIPDQNSAETPDRSPSRRSKDAAPPQASSIEPDTSGIGYKNTRRSDIDLLPSQVGRDSIDTFNPSLDLESRGVPSSYKYVTYRAAPKTKTKSPAMHVHLSGCRTFTIRSEKGVILQDDTPSGAIRRESSESCRFDIEKSQNDSQSPNRLSDPPTDNDFGSEECCEILTASTQNEEQHSMIPYSDVESSSPELLSDSLRVGTPVVKVVEMGLDKVTGGLGDEKPWTGDLDQFRRHKRKNAALRISTADLPREDNEGYPYITPTCSTVPVVSPNPISPARQLKVKNSIPRLMKALPPLPDAPSYYPPSDTMDAPEEEAFDQILVPFEFRHLNESLHQNQHGVVETDAAQGVKAVSDKQIDFPKFRLKIKTNSCPDIACENGTIDQRGQLLDTEAGGRLAEEDTRIYNRHKLKVRSPRRSRQSSSHSSTIRYKPGVGTPGIVVDLMQQRRQDLFSIPLKSETVLLRKRRNPLPQLTCPQIATTINDLKVVPLDKGGLPASSRVPSDLSNNNEIPVIDKDTLINSMPPHGLIKRLSGLRGLLPSSTMSAFRARDTGSARRRKAATGALTNVNFGSKNSISMTESPATEINQRRLSQRLQARLSRWVRGAKAAMRKCANRKHSRHEQEGRLGIE
ncbi:hypothetical protein SAMD00023353_0200970 [Rosellinia necatrix]|uniref:Uncharacterized protein n=1 Tax=Rosellinia necatrix TaxID=77044 RepID=A0A1S7UM63_ROSNE|nr:hypothetical protein SAMD00023353_0200970 [Rosellinia necatrix]